MRHSKRPSCSPVNYHPSPRFLACSPLSYQLSPRSGASGYQNRVHKNHEYLIACPVCLQLHAFLSDRLITWGSTARPLPPPLLFTFHLTPALAQRGTLPKPSAHILANWQPALGASQTPMLSVKHATAWQTGKPPIQPKYEAYYETASPHFRLGSGDRVTLASASGSDQVGANRGADNCAGREVVGGTPGPHAAALLPRSLNP